MDSFKSNPVFIDYAKCAVVLSLKMSFTAWTTVYHMVSSGGHGMRNPEDLIPGPCSPNPKKEMLEPYEPTEKQRRIMGHDLENNVPFFAVGLIYAILQAGPSTPLYIYTATKLLHHFVYWTGQRHEVRATVWTITNGSFLWMCKLVLDQLFV
mmetsp:Transcript_14916/g.43036  ORF Transcript_14916/g.43036 Transcript_14916/m.43036 type:complete len:152 (-) Transcript_14916:197-652(-)